MTTEQIQKSTLEELEQYTGTEQYFKIPFSDFVYTDGINHLINKCGCWWLISDLGIELNAINNQYEKNKKKGIKTEFPNFLIVSLKVNDDKTAVIEIKEDTDKKPIYTKKLNYTDFLLEEYEFYLIDKVFLLKSEY